MKRDFDIMSNKYFENDYEKQMDDHEKARNYIIKKFSETRDLDPIKMRLFFTVQKFNKHYIIFIILYNRMVMNKNFLFCFVLLLIRYYDEDKEVSFNRTSTAKIETIRANKLSNLPPRLFLIFLCFFFLCDIHLNFFSRILKKNLV